MSKSWDKHMIKLDELWLKKYDDLSKSEGWALFDHDGIIQIQVLDELEEGQAFIEDRDGGAYEFVSEKSLSGSKMHILALYLDGRNSQEIYIPRCLVR